MFVCEFRCFVKRFYVVSHWNRVLICVICLKYCDVNAIWNVLLVNRVCFVLNLGVIRVFLVVMGLEVVKTALQSIYRGYFCVDDFQVHFWTG